MFLFDSLLLCQGNVSNITSDTQVSLLSLPAVKTCNRVWQMSAGRHLLPEGWHPLRGSDTYAQSCQNLPVIGVVILEQCGCHRNLQLNVFFFFCLYTKCAFDLTRCTEYWVHYRTGGKKPGKRLVGNGKTKLLMNVKCMLSIFQIHLLHIISFLSHFLSLAYVLKEPHPDYFCSYSNISVEGNTIQDWPDLIFW